MRTLRICWDWWPPTSRCPWQRGSAASPGARGASRARHAAGPPSESGWPHRPTWPDRPATDKGCAPDRCQPAQESRSAQRPGLRVVASGAAPALGSPAGRPWEACGSLVPEVSAQACPPRAAGSGTSVLEGIAGQRRPARGRLRNPDWCRAPERSPFLPAVSIAQVPYSRPAALRKHAALRSLHPSALPLSGAVQHSLPQCRAGVPLAWPATSLLPCSCMEDAGKHAPGAGASGSRPRARAIRAETRGEAPGKGTFGGSLRIETAYQSGEKPPFPPIVQ